MSQRAYLESRVLVLEAALRHALDFFEDREDVDDGDYGVPTPNIYMQHASEIRNVLTGRVG